MSLKVEIDANSGFCGGVIRAISKAENFLDSHKGSKLYSLGSIVHNEEELNRLGEKGLVAIGGGDIGSLSGKDVLIRAHGEPPKTYALAQKNGLHVIDCTCPVVLQIQKQIREAYLCLNHGDRKGQIIIFGKVGHAEVLGLVGQVGGDALVIENMQMLLKAIEEGLVLVGGPLEIFSQTTKSPAEYSAICTKLEEVMAKANDLSVESFRNTGLLKIHNTICSQVASRYEQLSSFASSHDIIIFVSGKESSNGKVLFELCRSLNGRSYRVGAENEIQPSWFMDGDNVGVCGATSTPKWLLEAVAKKILLLL